MHIQPRSGIILFAKHSILNVWQCPEQDSVEITAKYFVQWPCALHCIRRIQNSGIFRTLLIQMYPSIFKHIKHYWDIFTHIKVLLRHIQAYSGIVSTLCNLCTRIHNLALLWALAYLELEAYSEPCETLTRQIQNYVIVRTVYSGIIQL